MKFSLQNKRPNTFRLLHQELSPYNGDDRWKQVFTVTSMLIFLVVVLGGYLTIEVALRTNTLVYAYIVIAAEVSAAILYYVSEKYDGLTTRFILASFIMYYAVLLLFHNGFTTLPPVWLFAYILFAFVSVGSPEGFLWAGLQAAIIFGGIIKASRQPDLHISGSDVLFFTANYALIFVLAYALDLARRSIGARVEKQNSELEDVNARYDVILNSIADALIVTDERGIIQFVNRKTIELCGFNKSELIDQPLTSVLVSKRSDDTVIPHKDRIVTQALATGNQYVLNQFSRDRQYLVRADDSKFLAAITVTPVKVLGKLKGAVMVFHDMSLEDEIDRAKSEFVSLASHQLRTPLNVVSWYAEKLLSQKKGTLNDAQKDYLNEIYTNNNRMISMVTDLLNVSRVELGRVKIKHEKVEVLPLAKALVKEVRPIVEQKKMNLSEYYFSDSIVFENSDQGIMTIIIQNLLSNAVKYTPENGKIAIHIDPVANKAPLYGSNGLTADNGEGIVISISDSGIGIPVAQQSKIFSKLFRADNVQSLDVSGTGLGLYVTQSFANALGGNIWFTSIEGNGTTFYVYLPYNKSLSL